MNTELVEMKGEYAWARVHAARENVEQMDADMVKLKSKMVGSKDKLVKNDLEEKWAEQEQEVLAKKEHPDSLKQKLG